MTTTMLTRTATEPTQTAAASLRSRLTVMATDPYAAGMPTDTVRQLRPEVDAVRHAFARRITADPESTGTVLAQHARFVDGIVVGLLRMARATAGVRSAVAPLTLLAVGGYAHGELALAEEVDLVAILPLGPDAARGRVMLDTVLQGLDALGIAVRCTVLEAGDLAQARRPGARDLVLGARHLAGAFGLAAPIVHAAA